MGNLLRRGNNHGEIAEQVIYKPAFEMDDDIPVQILFRNNLTKAQKQLLGRSQFLKKKTNTKTWCINFEEVEENDFYFFSTILQIRYLLTIWMGRQSTQCLFHFSVYPIRFPHLQKLVITQCQLQSIELISKINATSLTEINFSRNNLTTVRALRKISADIKVLNLQLNRITSWEDCEPLLWSLSEEVDALNFQEENQKNPSNDIKWLFKLRCKSCERITLASKVRIRQSLTIVSQIKKAFEGNIVPFIWIRY